MKSIWEHRRIPTFAEAIVGCAVLGQYEPGRYRLVSEEGAELVRRFKVELKLCSEDAELMSGRVE